MTDQENLNERDVGEPHAVIEAFIDGEEVDPVALKRALGDPAGVDHFVDLLLLRGAVSAMGPGMWSVPRRSASASRMRWWTAAAVVAGLAAGFVAGQRTMAAPPAQAAVESIVQVGSAPVAPEPTHVIALRPGVNWTEIPGGK